MSFSATVHTLPQLRCTALHLIAQKLSCYCIAVHINLQCTEAAVTCGRKVIDISAPQRNCGVVWTDLTVYSSCNLIMLFYKKKSFFFFVIKEGQNLMMLKCVLFCILIWFCSKLMETIGSTLNSQRNLSCIYSFPLPPPPPPRLKTCYESHPVFCILPNY